MRDRREHQGRVGAPGIDAWLVALVAVGVLATVACLVATRSQVGIETDSGPYLGAAYNVAHGRGVSTPFTFLSAYGPLRSVAFGDAVPLVEYPPLYPLLVGGLGALGVPLLEAVRYLGAVLLGVNVVLVGLLFLAVSKGRARPLAVVLGAFMIIGPTSPNLGAAGRTNWLTLSGSVLSEPVFIALVLSSTLLLVRSLDSGSLRALIGAAALAALAVLTRYVGVAVVAAGALTVLVIHRAWWRRAVLFSVIGLAPAAAWQLWLRIGEHADSGRRLAPHSAAGTWKDLVDAVEKWLLPSPWQSTLRHVLMLGVAIVVVLFALVQRRSGNLAFAPVVALCILTVCHMLALVVSRALFDVNAIDERMLAPLQPAAEIVAAAFVWSGLRTLWSPRAATATVAGVMGVLMAISVHPIAAVVDNGFRPISLSPSSRAVRTLPRDVPVFATSAAAIWFATGRSAYELPTRVNGFTLERNHDYRAHMREFAALAARRRLAIVLILAPNIQNYPSLADLEKIADVRWVHHYRDGAVALVGGHPRG